MEARREEAEKILLKHIGKAYNCKSVFHNRYIDAMLDFAQQPSKEGIIIAKQKELIDSLKCSHVDWDLIDEIETELTVLTSELSEPKKPSTEVKMRIVYIAHPINGDIKGNLEKIRKIIRGINLMFTNIVPFAHYFVDCYALDDNKPEERERGIRNDIALFKAGFIDELWLFGDRISNGMAAEIELAKSLNIPIHEMFDLELPEIDPAKEEEQPDEPKETDYIAAYSILAYKYDIAEDDLKASIQNYIKRKVEPPEIPNAVLEGLRSDIAKVETDTGKLIDMPNLEQLYISDEAIENKINELKEEWGSLLTVSECGRKIAVWMREQLNK